MGKKSQKQDRKIERYFADIARQLDEVVSRAEQQNTSLIEELERFEATARLVGVRMAEVQAEVDEDRAALKDAHAEALVLAGDLEVQALARFGEIGARGDAALAALESSLASECERAATRIDEMVERSATESAVRLDASVPEELERFEATARLAGVRMAEVQAEVDEDRAALKDAHVAALVLAGDLEVQARARFEEIGARADAALAALEASLASECERAVTRVDEMVERSATESAAVQDAHAAALVLAGDLEVQARALEASLASECARAVTGVDEIVERSSMESAVRLDASVRMLDEQSAEFGEQLTSRLEEIRTIADREVQETQEWARRRIEDAVALVEQWAREAREDVTTVAPVSPAAPEPDEPATDVSEEPVMWSDSLTAFADNGSDGSSDDRFFSELAAELRDDPERDQFPTPIDAEVPGVGIAAAATTTTTTTTTMLESRPEPAVTRAPTRPVQVGVSLAALTASTEVLVRYAADERVRIEVVHATAGEGPVSFLRLTAYNVAGWWEYHDVPAHADLPEPRSAVIGLGELRNALDLARQEGESEIDLLMNGDLTIGNVLLLDQPGTDPVLPYHRQRIERVDLRSADSSGLNVETQVGRLFIPPRLISFLKGRNYSTAEILTFEEWRCLGAEIAGPSPDTSATIVTRLEEAGAATAESEKERRSTGESEVAQLVRALSVDTAPEELEQILHAGVGYARRRAAAHPALPVDVIEDLIREGTEAIRAAAASNPSASEAACALAAADSSEVVRAAVAANSAVTADCLEALAADSAAEVRERAASNAMITRELIVRMADDADSSVRATAAANRNMDPDLLSALAHDADPRVCAAVARNPGCPGELLNELLGLVPDAVLANPSAPAAVLAAGSRVYAGNLRLAVAANPATPAKQLQALARDDDLDVVRAVAENPTTPANIRRRAKRRLHA